MFSEDTLTALNLCLKKRIPFALYILPGQQTPRFLACRAVGTCSIDDTSNGFLINAFNNEYGLPVIIRDELSERDIVDCAMSMPESSLPEIHPYEISTVREEYIELTNKVIYRLKIDGGKSVISRVICGDASRLNIAGIIQDYFDAFRSTFRYVYYSPRTGAWMGASPEILVERNSGDSHISTMSLAGTRKRADASWDDKNMEEHDYVTNYIVDVLKSLGLNPKVGMPENIGFGSIEHLCHRIQAECNLPLVKVANALSPTPALAGFPLEKALEHICFAEKHPRRCYGGYVGCSDESGTHIYVNLRCMHFSENKFCIYAGGGITRKSDAESEWNETAAKSSVLFNLIKKYETE